MTSQASLNKSFPQQKAPRYAFTSGFGIGSLALAGIAFALWLSVCGTPGDMAKSALNTPSLLYSLIGRNFANFIYVIMLGQAAITAIMNYGFILNKRSSTVYFSLPVSRNSLFIGRFASGFIVSVVPHLLGITYALCINLYAFGSSEELTQAYLIICLAIFVTQLAVFAITTAVCSLVGTIPETLAFTVLIIFGIFFLAYGLQYEISALLYGNAIGEYTASYNYLTAELISYAGPYIPGYPAAFFMMMIGSRNVTTDDSAVKLWDFVRESEAFAPAFIWLGLSAAIIFLASRAFKRYKAENAGALGVCAPLNFYGTFVPVFFFFNALLFASNLGNTQAVLWAVVSSALAFLTCRFLLTLSLRKTLSPRGFIHYAAMLSITGVIAVICLTGMFGYNSRKPEKDDILMAQITYHGAPDFISGGSQYGTFHNFNYYGSENDEPVFLRDFYNLVYKTPGDIQTVLDLHQQLIDAGPGYFDRERVKLEVCFTYGMKDGETIVRRLYHYVPAEFVTGMIAALDETDAVKEHTARALDKHIEMAGIAGMPNVTITDYLFGNARNVAEGYEQAELFRALQADIDVLGFNEKYFPSSQPLAVVQFPRLNEEGGIERGNSYVYSIRGNNIVAGYSEDFNDYSTFGGTNNIRFFITEDFANTLAYLAKLGFDAAPDITNVTELYALPYDYRPNYYTIAPYFRSYASMYSQAPSGVKQVPADKISELLDLCQSNYLVTGGGYLIKVRVEEDLWATLFLPENAAPDYIK